MKCPATTGCLYDWGCDECPLTADYDALSSDDLRKIMYTCKDILASRHEYLWKVSTD